MGDRGSGGGVAGLLIAGNGQPDGLRTKIAEGVWPVRAADHPASACSGGDSRRVHGERDLQVSPLPEESPTGDIPEVEPPRYFAAHMNLGAGL